MTNLEPRGAAARTMSEAMQSPSAAPAERETKQHELRTWPSFFEAVRSGEKTFEVRRHDRDFAVGDTLVLREWDPENGAVTAAFGYTGRNLGRRISYVMPGGRFGVDPHFCVLGLAAPDEAPR